MAIKIEKPQSLVLFVIPAILIVVGVAFLQQMAPIYAGAGGYDQDPAYVYLLNGLTILDGHSPFHIDHPGTPLQVLIAIVALIQWVLLTLGGKAGGDVVSSVLRQPESYIVTASLVLLMLNAWAVYYFGRQISQATGNFKLALFCQTSPLLYWIVAGRIVYLSPEALLIFASLVLLGLLTPFILSDGESQGKGPGRAPVLAGIICGFGVVVKVTFVPMVGLLLLLGSRNDVFRAVKYMVVSGLVCMLPILGGVGRMVSRHTSFAVHSGRHGGGEADVINIDAVPERIAYLYDTFPLFFAVLLILAVVVFFRAVLLILFKGLQFPAAESNGGYILNTMAGFLRRLESMNIRVPIVLFTVGVFQTLLVLKHPGPHYMIPVLPVACLGLVYLVRLAGSKWGGDIVLLGFGCISDVNRDLGCLFRIAS